MEKEKLLNKKNSSSENIFFHTIKNSKKTLLLTFFISLFLQFIVFGFFIFFEIDHNQQEEYCTYTAHISRNVVNNYEKNYVISWSGFVFYEKENHKGKNIYVQYDGRDIKSSNYIIQNNFCRLTTDAIKLIKLAIVFSLKYSTLLSAIIFLFILINNFLRGKHDRQTSAS